MLDIQIVTVFFLFVILGILFYAEIIEEECKHWRRSKLLTDATDFKVAAEIYCQREDLVMMEKGERDGMVRRSLALGEFEGWPHPEGLQNRVEELEAKLRNNATTSEDVERWAWQNHVMMVRREDAKDHHDEVYHLKAQVNDLLTKNRNLEQANKDIAKQASTGFWEAAGKSPSFASNLRSWEELQIKRKYK